VRSDVVGGWDMNVDVDADVGMWRSKVPVGDSRELAILLPTLNFIQKA
jgi:hypothetical protein